MAKLSVNQLLSKAKFHAKKGDIEEAEKLYQAVLKVFPKNKRAQKSLADLNKPEQFATTQGLPQNIINQLINLYNQGQLAAVVVHAQAIIEQYPEAFIVWNILGSAYIGLGKALEASSAFKRVTELNPNYAYGHCNFGIALHQQGKQDEAAEAYSKALAIKPDYAEVYNNMGLILHEQGKLEEAIEAYNKALTINPDNAETYNNKGNILKDQGKQDVAIEAYSKALAIKPDYTDAYYNTGTTLHEQGKLDEAIEAYNKALAIKPDNAEAYNNMGNAFKDQGKLDEAIVSYEKVLSLKPDYADAYYNMGTTLHEQGKPDEAIEAYNKALAIKPDNAEAYNNMGNAFKDQGKLDEVIASYEKALSLNPDYFEVYNNMGITLQDQGKLDEAIASYNEALALKPEYGEAHRNLSSLIKYKSDDTQVALVSKVIKRFDLKDDNRCHLHYAYAKMSEDLGDLDAAYDNYVSGGKLRQKLLSYDLKQDELTFQKIKNTAPNLKKFAFSKPFDSAINTPIFILGMPRSGTTLVEQIVSSHSQVYGAGELTFLNRFSGSLSLGNQVVNSDNVLQIRNAYLTELDKVSNGCPFVTDKMPQNFLYIGLIFKAFPEAKVIHVKRDPVATCWSNFKHYFFENGLGFSYNLNDTAHYFKMYLDLMEFWEQQYGNQIYHLDYERLTIEQELETRKLIKHVGLDWEDICLSPQKNKRSVKTASQQQVREKVYAGSSQAWRKFEPYLNGMFDEFESRSAPRPDSHLQGS